MEEVDGVTSFEIYTVWSNTDLTEGRGYNYARYLCTSESTAIRLSKGCYIQGGNGEVTKEKALRFNGKNYYSGVIVSLPTDSDLKQDKILKEKTLQAVAKNEIINNTSVLTFERLIQLKLGMLWI